MSKQGAGSKRAFDPDEHWDEGAPMAVVAVHFCVRGQHVVTSYEWPIDLLPDGLKDEIRAKALELVGREPEKRRRGV